MTTLPSHVVSPPPMPSLPVIGTDATFPIRRVFCVGRNYAAHAREMGADPSREPPFFFCKPSDGVIPLAADGSSTIAYPPLTKDLHHELEMVVAIGKGGANIPAESGIDHVYGYALGLDLTRRDLQAALKAKGHPWEMGKAFDQSAPMTPVTPAAQTGPLTQGTLRLTVNGVVKQEGQLADMIWSVGETIAHLSRFVALAPGDLIFTGTPEGVGPLLPGDVLEGSLAPLPPLRLRIV